VRRGKTLRIVGACLLAAFILRFPLGWALTPSPEDVLTPGEVLGTGHGPLVVLLHGMAGRQSVEPLIQAMARDPSLKNARVLAPGYNSAFYVNTDPDLIVGHLRGAIELAAKNGVSEIVLVGHSLGGMLLREAYLLSIEHNAGWDKKVSRIVLLASLNRGWTTSIAREPLQRALVEVGSWVLPSLHVGGLYDQLRRGAPFIANLRLRWLRKMRELHNQELARNNGTKLIPDVVQLRGALDVVLTNQDSADLEDTHGFRAVEIPRTDHGGVLDLQGELGKQRATTILAEIAGRGPPGIFPDNEKSSCLSGVDERPTHVVFAVHGMGTTGAWTGAFKTQAQEEKLLADERDTGASPQPQAVVERVDYPWFPMVPFLFGFERQQRLHYFVDKYTEFEACHPNLLSRSALAHSNGTYIVANAMKQIGSISLQRFALVGSVLPEKFNWELLASRKQIDRVANYRSGEDGIVGVFPGAYDWVYFQYAELGAAGVWGFDGAPSFVTDVQWFAGGHSKLIQSPKGRREVARFLVNGTVPPSPLFRSEVAWWLEVLGNLSGFIWLGIVGILVWIGRLIHRKAAVLRTPGRPTWVSAAPLAVYVAVLAVIAFCF
jgi:pimeloyl-ACP methyl ester carboxylesterase